MQRSWILGMATLVLGTSLSLAFAQPQSGEEPIVPNPNAPPVSESASPSAPGSSGSPAAVASPAPQEAPPTHIFISDTGNHRLVRLDSWDSPHQEVLGRPGHGMGYFLHPAQVWVDPLGKIFVADRDNDRIVRVDEMNGKGWTELQAGFKHPEGVASRGDEFYVADTGNNQVLVFKDMKGEPIRTYKDARLDHPTSLWLDKNKDLYVTCGQDPPGGRIVKIVEPPPPPPPDPKAAESPKPEPPKAEPKFEVYDGENLKPVGFAPSGFVNWNRQLWMVCPVSSRLLRVDNFRGRSAREWGGYGAAIGKFRSPSGLGLTPDGKLLVADTGNDRIVLVDGVDPKDWKAYSGAKDGVGLRSPASVFSWCAVPKPKPPEEEGDKKKKDKDKS